MLISEAQFPLPHSMHTTELTSVEEMIFGAGSSFFLISMMLNSNGELKEVCQWKKSKILNKMCFEDPDTHLWKDIINKIPEVKPIFDHIKSLEYYDKPEYCKISDQLLKILARFEAKEK